MKKAIGLVLVMFCISAVVIAQSPEEKDPAQSPNSDARAQTGRRDDMRNRRQGYQQMLERRKEDHQKMIAELESIKKIAEEEGASKTVKAIQQLIDKKNAEFQQRMEQFESQRRERSKQLQQRTGGRPQRTPNVKEQD